MYLGRQWRPGGHRGIQSALRSSLHCNTFCSVSKNQHLNDAELIHVLGTLSKSDRERNCEHDFDNRGQVGWEDMPRPLMVVVT
ncbi:hypothetical protein N7517_006088 [Penicillium concentricum]|uniref:Uncharacterized protein n=1 Tax=Penicillium concentricum TaxID=293559 RepID=A0A9W9V9T1_9EURO|nr:uncharacterized protein N7517_006088 [Penicillium concentricum]KAJ5374082.1 hypothetical protein N7517_006088 [Penicillium concentricum]